MQKKLTITVDEEIYDKLYKIIGRGNISRFIEMLLRRYFIKEYLEEDLESAYQQMAKDETRESEALEWAEATIGDVSYETRRSLVGKL
jgi:hypothetical protein